MTAETENAASVRASADNLRGAFWMLVSVAGATVMTLGVREASDEVHSVMLAFLRSALGAMVVLPLLGRLWPGSAQARRAGPIRFTAWKLHLARGLVFAGALNGGFYAIWQLPLALASALFFLAPVFATAFAGPLLGERVGPRRWAAVGAGFLGAMVILRPGTEGFDPAMLAAVASAMCFGTALVMGRLASDRDGPDAVFVSSSVVVALGTLPPALFFWEWPTRAEVWVVIGAVVLASSLRAYADVRAYAVGDAGFLAPITYLRLVTVGVAGYLLFGETLDAATLAGSAIIVGATLMIALRERGAAVRARRRAAALDAES
ncbi:MAG: DMT family transporter [Paracoccaceae bacterium]